MSSLKLQFKVQKYQTDAVNAVVDCFEGQPFADGISYRVDPGRSESPTVYDESGLKNAEVASGLKVLETIRAVQKRTPGLKQSEELVKSPAAPINLDVEMETGTGKTYVYIKTIMELHQRYGWSKYIIVVPSIAIREGVKKTFEITADHFQQAYGTKPRMFVYNSSRLHDVERFSSDVGVQVMVINIQAFNATGADARRIYEELDDFQSRRPIDVIAANRPILIIDEPQKIGGDGKKASKSLDALGRFNALFALRYSATHRIDHNKVHRLDALDAYNQKLVKKIAVRGVTVRGLAGSTAYLYVDGTEVGKGKDFPRARIELEVQTATGIRRLMKRVSKGSRLHDLSGGIEAYKDLVVVDVDANRDIIELSDSSIVMAGQITEDVAEDTKRRIQIREVIRAHLDKERELFAQNIKVLSLFFIDQVAKYRDYSREDSLGEYARVFEEEYEALKADLFSQLPLDDNAEQYRKHLESIHVRNTHEGYFSIDKKGHSVDGQIKKTGETAGQSDDVDAYDLILKDKERLLSFEEPVRFIFSHSALREGWDNPNVFTLGILKKSDNNVSRRQEIGRGLRIAVNTSGERMDKPETVHEINELTVVTDESYTDFVAALQKEIVESLSGRPRKAAPDYFVGKIVVDENAGAERSITADDAKKLVHWLTVNEFIDYEQHVTDKWRDRVTLESIPELPAGLQVYFAQISELVDSLDLDVPTPPDGRKLKRIPLNEENFAKQEFRELWDRINRKAVYQVEFDSAELIQNCVTVLDKSLNVAAMQYVVVSGEQRDAIEAEQLAAGEGFKVSTTKVEESKLSAGSTVKYDLLGEIAEKTTLTRRTCAAILTAVLPTTFAKFKQNPEQFITESARLINEQKATAIIQHLSYDLLDGGYDSSIFTENQTAQDLTKAGEKLKKSVFEYVVTDSQVERSFVTELDTSDEVVVYSKLPRGFFIPTPVGDYNPDWAIAFKEGVVKHVYFVAETKGSMSTMQLKKIEEVKIDCAREFFKTINSKAGSEQVTYDVVSSFDELLQLVGA